VRRSIYLFSRRNLRVPLLEAFDSPDPNLSCDRRMATTTAPQALTLMNGEWMFKRAAALSHRVVDAMDTNTAVDPNTEVATGTVVEADTRVEAHAARESEDQKNAASYVQAAYQLVLQRAADEQELATAVAFLKEQQELFDANARQTATADNPSDEQPNPKAFSEMARQAALVDLCHVLLNSNEFVYVD
jgi:hypothetical protein